VYRNAKAIGVFAIPSAIMLAGLAFFWHAADASSAKPADILHSFRGYFSDAVAVAVSTSMGRIGILVLSVLLLEILVVGWNRSSIFRLIFGRRPTAIVDALYFLLTLLNLTVFLEIAFTLGTSILASRVIAWVSSNYGWSRITLPSDGIFEIGVGFAIYWLAMSLVQYWGHRLMHTPIFWHLHRFHHAATELNMITAFRVHPLEPVVLRPLTLISPLIFFNVPPRILLVYFILGTVIDLLAHSQLPWGYGWIGRWVAQSPRVHQVHHSIDDEHQNLHFSICPLWDHLFGTWYKGTKLPSGYGIPDPAYEVHPLTQFVLDAGIFYANITRWLRTPLRRLRMSGTDSTPAR
jgi:sterol desaturase/sphingolipid hydroxylase (fatty acid hydroxylase superfamily)